MFQSLESPGLKAGISSSPVSRVGGSQLRTAILVVSWCSRLYWCCQMAPFIGSCYHKQLSRTISTEYFGAVHSWELEVLDLCFYFRLKFILFFICTRVILDCGNPYARLRYGVSARPGMARPTVLSSSFILACLSTNVSSHDVEFKGVGAVTRRRRRHRWWWHNNGGGAQGGCVGGVRWRRGLHHSPSGGLRWVATATELGFRVAGGS
jgi:hypothetical protein